MRFHGQRHCSDKQIDEAIGLILRIGVALSSLMMLVGGLLYLYKYGGTLPDYRVFRGEPTDLCSVGGIISDTLAARSRGMVQSGVLLLIATPVLRVAFTVLAFALQKDRTYVTVTLVVLGLLLYSLAGGVQ